MWKWIFGIVLVLTLLVGGAAWYAESSGLREKFMQQMNPKMRAKEVRFGTVETGKVVRTINAPGELEPVRVVEISAEVSARIVELNVKENDRVRQGQVLLRLDARDLQAIVDAARAQLESEEARLEGARAEVVNAEVELNRRQKLVAGGDIAAAELDAARLAYDRATSALRQVEHSIVSARANIRRAEKDLSNTTIASPIDGIITKLNAEIGETVVVGTLNNPGSVILEVADLDVMLVKARVDEANIAKVAVGQNATVFVNAFPDMRLTGKVTAIGLKREQDQNGARYFETEILIERPADLLLRSGLTASVDIDVEMFNGVLKAPTQAILDRAVDELPAEVTRDNPNIEPGKKFVRVVYVEKAGKAWPVPVLVGPSDQTHTVIKSGVDAGARIVTGPFKVLTKLEHEQTITEEKPREPGEKGKDATAVAADGAQRKPA
ncbi:MAG TPA: efflux RND transporter periplasmic adaptor subunit [Phycisphaerales bacterium]|nr:efflux RND transporter periplasmic adaptor subunit [Phycisphaerales bacterium]